MSLLAIAWRDVCFAHWPLPPAAVAEALPPGLEVDTYDGTAWLGVVALRIEAGLDAPFSGASEDGHAGSVGEQPGQPVGGFAELNLRTYVTRDGEPGVYFFSLDAADATAVRAARAVYGLPYYRAEARHRVHTDAGRETRFDHRRTHSGAEPARFTGTFAPDGERATAEAGSLVAFLLERYRYYLHRAGRVWAGEIDHVPWRPAPATASIASNTLPEAAGLPPVESDPHLLYAAHDGMTVSAGPLRPV